MTVPYITAAIEYEDSFVDYKKTGLDVELLEGYAPIMKSWSVPLEPPPREPTPTPLSLAWFKSYNPPLPPRLQKGFPANIVRLSHWYKVIRACSQC